MVDRGKGLKTSTLYKWVKQPNGCFTILGVPIFKEHTREMDGDDFVVTAEHLNEIAMNQQSESADGYYPRIHVGHHSGGVENREGFGFGDAFYVENGVLYADLVEIPEDKFARIENYPYRSVEYDPKENRIGSIALLESCEPWFRFPCLRLSDSPLEISEEYSSYCQERSVLLYQLEHEKMPIFPKKEKEKYMEPSPPDEKEGGENGDYSYMKKYMDDEGFPKFQEMIDGAMSKHMEEHHKEKYMENENSREPYPEDKGGVSSSSISFQKESNDLLFQKMEELTAQIKKLKAGGEVEKYSREIRAIYQANPSINVSGEISYLRTMESTEEMDRHVKYLKTVPYSKSSHPATQHLEAVTKRVEKSITEKYGGDTRAVSLARKLAIAYQKTANEGYERERKTFLRTWPSCEKFVEFFTQEEIQQPGYCDRTIFKN